MSTFRLAKNPLMTGAYRGSAPCPCCGAHNEVHASVIEQGGQKSFLGVVLRPRRADQANTPVDVRGVLFPVAGARVEAPQQLNLESQEQTSP